MAYNVFDTSGSVQAVTENQTPMQQGIVDQTPAMAIQAVGGLASKAAGELVSQHTVNQAKNILDNPQEVELPDEIKPYVERMNGLADKVKAGLQQREAQVKARAIMAEAMNQYPFFAKEIRERGATLFGIGGSSSSLGKASIDVSPEEKALNDYREAVTTVQMEYGVTQQTAMDIIQKQRANELRKVTATDFVDDIYVATNEAALRTQDEIFKTMFNTKTGTLDLTQQRTLNIGVERGALQLQKTLMEAATKHGAITKDTFETIEQQVTQFKTNMKALINDQTTTKWLTEHNDLAAQITTSWGYKHYGALKFLAENNILPESMKEISFRAMAGNETAKALIKANPFLSDLLTKSSGLGEQLRKAYGAVIDESIGNPPQNTEKDKEISGVGDAEKITATTLALNEPRSGATWNIALLKENGASAQPVIDKALRAAPENITRWLSDTYKFTFRNDAELKRETINHELDVVTSSLRGALIGSGMDDAAFQNITFEEPRKRLLEVAGKGKATLLDDTVRATPELVVSGVSDNYTRSRLHDVYKVLKDNPEIWEKFADSPAEYLNLLIKRPLDWKQPIEYRVKKAAQPTQNLQLSGLQDDFEIKKRVQKEAEHFKNSEEMNPYVNKYNELKNKVNFEQSKEFANKSLDQLSTFSPEEAFSSLKNIIMQSFEQPAIQDFKKGVTNGYEAAKEIYNTARAAYYDGPIGKAKIDSLEFLEKQFNALEQTLAEGGNAAYQGFNSFLDDVSTELTNMFIEPLNTQMQAVEPVEEAPEAVQPTRSLQLSDSELKAFEEFKSKGITPEALKTMYSGLRYKDPKLGEVQQDAPELLDPANLLGKYEQYYRG